MRILLIAIILFTCAPLWAQVNYVQNAEFEVYSTCPEGWNQVYRADGWRNARDSVMSDVGLEYYNACANSRPDRLAHVPDNAGFFQNPHSGNGMMGVVLYFDKKPSSSAAPTPLPFNYRDYLQGHLVAPLIAGKTYCISFWTNLTEASGYGNNKIGVYLDNGVINISADTPGSEILSVTPQIYTNDVITDTARWVKIEGSFIATGIEDHSVYKEFHVPELTKNTSGCSIHVTVSNRRGYVFLRSDQPISKTPGFL